jgi:hypothetical protein
MRLQPLPQILPGHAAGGDTFEQGDRFVLLIGRSDAPGVSVAIHELEQTQEPCSLIPVRQRVITDQVPCQHGGLLDELRVCLDAAVAGGRGGKSRGGKCHETVDADQRLGRDAEDAFRDREVVGKIEVVDARYRASLSRIA